MCPSCGIFRITEEFRFSIPIDGTELHELLYRVSYQFRQASQGLKNAADLPVHYESELLPLLQAVDPSVEKKLETFLILMGKASSYPGDRVRFHLDTDYPLVSARNGEECLFLLQSLASQGHIELEDFSLSGDVATYIVTTRGWLQIEAINSSGSESSDAFIAMWFDATRTKYDQAIASAIRSAGYEPVRIDRIEHVNHIDDEIIARIRRSRFLIADFTGQRNGVYFEAGFMLGLGRPVVWLCEKSELANVHFDTRQYNTIDYVDAADLERRLQVRIEAILGRGPLKPSA